MGKLLDFAAKFIERRGVDDPNHWIIRLLGRQNKTGYNVDADSALGQSAVFACVRVISETIASLPLMVYKRRKDGGKDVADGHWLYPFLHDSPNNFQTAHEFREMQVGHTALRGNAYSFIQRDNAGRVLQIIPLHPDKVEPEFKDFTNYDVQYKYRDPDSHKQITLSQSECWHLKGLSSDGLLGLSPITLAANSIGLAMSAEDHGISYYKNGAKTSGIVKHPGTLKEDAHTRLKTSVQDAISGDNKFKIIVLENGMDWVNVGMSATDSQYLETRSFQVQEIARLFRVPCILIGHPDTTTTYASAEQMMMSFVIHCIRPWLVRIEQSINKTLLTKKEQGRYFAEFKLDALLRGDTATRYQAYASAITNRWMSPNEVRALENMNPREGGDTYENPNTSSTQGTQEDLPLDEAGTQDATE